MKTKKIILFGFGTLLAFLTFYSNNLILAADSSFDNSQNIKVIKPSSGTKIKEENDITINWKEYKGEFDHYRISLRNKLVPDLVTSGQIVPKEKKEFTFNGENLTAHHVEFWQLNSGGILLNKLRKNFYFEIIAINSSMQPVANGYSKTFSILEDGDKNSFEIKSNVKSSIKLNSQKQNQKYLRESSILLSWKTENIKAVDIYLVKGNKKYLLLENYSEGNEFSYAVGRVDNKWGIDTLKNGSYSIVICQTGNPIDKQCAKFKFKIYGKNTEISILPSLNDPWAIIDKIKDYSKNRNKAGFDSLVYDPEKMSCDNKKECESMFKFLDVMLFDSLNKNDYVDRWEDNKQMILVSKLMPIDNADEKSGSINHLFFAKDDKGNLKFIGYDSSGLGFSRKGTNRSDSVLEADIQAAIADVDKDGLSDQKEKCENYFNEYIKDCKVTDPAKRDTDGDGWWDGVEAKFE